MAKSIRVNNLPERPAYGVCLYCPSCGGRYSATRGDYFMTPPGQAFHCWNDDTLLQLVTVRTVIEQVRR